MTSAFLKTFLVLFLGTSSGYLFQKISVQKKWLKTDSQKKVSIFLQKLAMLWLISITYVGSLWIFQFESLLQIVTMPFLGVFSTIIGGYLAIVMATRYGYNQVDIGSIFTCGYFANFTFGGMICFFILGEEGYALVPIFTFFMRFLYFGFGFPLAHNYGDSQSDQKNLREKVLEAVRDPFFYIGIGTMLFGLILNASSFQRPVGYTKLNEILIPLTNFILFFSIGLNLKFSRLTGYVRECIYISLIKFIVVPASVLLVAWLLGYHAMSQGLPLKVSLILAAMPVAFNSVITANIYHLNTDLTTSCWFFTTLEMLVILPFFMLVIRLF